MESMHLLLCLLFFSTFCVCYLITTFYLFLYALFNYSYKKSFHMPSVFILSFDLDRRFTPGLLMPINMLLMRMIILTAVVLLVSGFQVLTFPPFSHTPEVSLFLSLCGQEVQFISHLGSLTQYCIKGNYCQTHEILFRRFSVLVCLGR